MPISPPCTFHKRHEKKGHDANLRPAALFVNGKYQQTKGGRIEETLFGCDPDGDFGFCLGSRLGEGRGTVSSGKFCVPHLRKI